MTKEAKPAKHEQKAILSINYIHLVVDIRQAANIFALLQGVELRENKYVDGKSYTIIHPMPDNAITLTYLSDEQYAVDKMTGKAEQLKEENKSV